MLRLQWPALAEDAFYVFAADLGHSRLIEAMQWRQQRSNWRRARTGLSYWLLSRFDPIITRRKATVLSWPLVFAGVNT